MNTWADRIRSRMKELGLTQEELADKLGITRGAVTHYLAGRRVPPLSKFNEIAKVLKSDAAWLQFGTVVVSQPSIKTSNNATQTTAYRSIPILSWEQAAKNPQVRNLKQEDIKETIPHIFTDQLQWYALHVKGDSMVASSGSKSFHEGDIIIVDPIKEPKHGDFVIAVLPKAKEATFKQFVLDNGKLYLKPLNIQYPLLEITNKGCICGIVTQDLVNMQQGI
jgi:SOS-response transcriptional repressor LexA